MESTLYQSAMAKGAARAEANLYAETLVRVLGHRLGALDPAVRERIRAVTDLETLKLWHDEVLFLNDAEAARRLVEKIRNAPLG